MSGRAAGRPAAIAFDLDGTLVDSRRDLATAVNRLRGELDLVPLAPERVGEMVGEGARVLVARALADARSAPGLDAALARFLVHYDAVCLETTRPYPGIPELVAALAAVYPLAVVTNKPARPTERILDHCGLRSSFRLLVAGDTLAVRKPDAAVLIHAARELGCAPADLLLVGDSAIDAQAAVAAGCRLALVAWGYGKAVELAGAPAELRAADPAALAAALLP